VRRLSPGWRGILEKWDIRLALLRPASSLAHELSRDSRWARWYCDSVAVILRRAPEEPAPYSRSAADSAERALISCAHPAQSASPSPGNTDE
jgi:hypothetical protein